jgi:hypothetical protein
LKQHVTAPVPEDPDYHSPGFKEPLLVWGPTALGAALLLGATVVSFAGPKKNSRL